MPYDDTDVKKMIKYQTERKVGFSRHKISSDVKDLIHGILEAKTDQRFSISDIQQSAWMTVTPHDPNTATTTTSTTITTTTGSREQEALPDDATKRAAAVTDHPATDELPRRPPANTSLNNNDIKPSRLASANAEAAVMHRHQQGTAHRMVPLAHYGSAAVPRSAARRRLEAQPSAAVPAPAIWAAAVVVREKVRTNGR